MSTPARNEFKYKDYYKIYQDRYGTQPPSLTVTLLDRSDQASETLKSPGMAARRRGEATWLPPLPYNRKVTRDVIDFGYTRVVWNDPLYSWSEIGGLDPGEPLNPIDSSVIIELWNTAERKALQKLKNQHVNFAQFFVEAGQTASLLSNAAKTMAKALPKVKRGNIVGALKDLGFGSNNRQRRKAADLVRKAGKQIAEGLSPAQLGKDTSKNAKAAAGNWLAMSFGWGPLLSDVNGSAELLAERSTQDNKRTRFSVRAQASEQTPWDFYQDYGTLKYRHSGVRKQTAMVRLDFYFSSAYLASLSADGLTNPAALAWEELPFSFLADYCWGIGDWLGNLDSSVGKEFIGGSVSLSVRYTSHKEQRYSYSNPNYFVDGRASRTKTLTDFQRHVYGGFPDATMIALAVKNPLKSKTHVANSLAILATAVDDFLNKR